MMGSPGEEPGIVDQGWGGVGAPKGSLHLLLPGMNSSRVVKVSGGGRACVLDFVNKAHRAQ